jgi:hypothetical protein
VTAHADRDSLPDRMVVQMHHELTVNVHKGDWLTLTPEQHEHEVIYHALKLLLAARASDTESVREYAADVANHAAMLADAHGALDLAHGQGEPGYDAHGSDVLRDLADRLLVLIDSHGCAAPASP